MCVVGISVRLVKRWPINVITSTLNVSTLVAKAFKSASETKSAESSVFRSAIFFSTASKEAILLISVCKALSASSKAFFKAASSSALTPPPCPALSNASWALVFASSAAVLAAAAAVLASAIEDSNVLTLEFNSSSEAFLSNCPCKSLMSSS